MGRDEEDEAMSEADLEDLEDLDEGDVKFPGRSADVDSAGHSADDQQHPTSRAVCPFPSDCLLFLQRFVHIRSLSHTSGGAERTGYLAVCLVQHYAAEN